MQPVTKHHRALPKLTPWERDQAFMNWWNATGVHNCVEMFGLDPFQGVALAWLAWRAAKR